MKKDFNGPAEKSSTWTRENAPDPAKVAEAGIVTKESLAWRAAQHPKQPAPSYDIDQSGIREASLDQERARQRQNVENDRARLERTSRKARQDFRTARDYGGRDHER